MKHFLKPLGHCLTTAVMTSAMLEVYALPAVEAATPNPLPNTQSSPEAPALDGEAAFIDAPTSSSTPAIAPPEVIAPIQAAPVETSIVESAVESLAAPAADSAGAIDAASQDTDADPVASEPLPSGNGQKPSVNIPATKPQAAESAPAEPDAKPAAEIDSTVDLNSNAPKPAPNSTEKAEAQSRTIAGMRQILEKKLATIVERDKADRNAQWQKNLMYSALQAAWVGNFKHAREIATHPALPLEIQTDLLDKIAAIETQAQLGQIAQQPNSAQAKNQGSSTTQGRVVPSGYPTVYASSAIGARYAGVSLGNQCPALDRSVIRPEAAKAAQVAQQPVAKPGKAKPGMPAFIPALGQNLATRLAQLNRTQTAKTQVAKSRQSGNRPVSPMLFAGVATNSLTKLKISQLQVALTHPVAPPQQTTPIRQTTQAPQIKPVAQATQVVAAHQVASVQIPQLMSVQPLVANPPQVSADNMIAGNEVSQPATQQNETTNHDLDQWAGSTLPLSFEPFGFSLLKLPDSLNFGWNWWPIPSADSSQAGRLATVSADVSANADGQPQNLDSILLAAETGLATNPWLQTLEQDLTELSFTRNVRKVSLPDLSALAKSKTTTAAKPALYDTTALMAMSCANAQLAPYSQAGDEWIDPANAKKLGWVNLMFPLPIPSVITSAFGWRIHPISGSLSFHSGLDIGAPMGTPVLAALGGRVVAADHMGGYGLAVVVEDETTQQRNLYGHLSGIAVQAGMRVAQGAILGWVGSTGNSTGPHLHFESLLRTKDGWTAIDPIASAAVAVAQGR